MSDHGEEPNDDILQGSENGDEAGDATNGSAELVEEGDEHQNSLANDESEVLNDTAENDLEESTVDDPVSSPTYLLIIIIINNASCWLLTKFWCE